MPEQLALFDTETVVPSLEKKVYKLTWCPMNIPFLLPHAQIDKLSQAAGFDGSSLGLYSEYFRKNYYLSEFWAIIGGRDKFSDPRFEVLTYAPVQPARAERMLRKIKALFMLEQFPLGKPEQWRCPYTGHLWNDMVNQSKAPIIPLYPEVEKPRKQLPLETKIRIRKLLAARRAIKKWGWFAQQFLLEEYERKGWVWGDEDELIWARANTPIKRKPSPYQKAKARRKTENDQFLT